MGKFSCMTLKLRAKQTERVYLPKANKIKNHVISPDKLNIIYMGIKVAVRKVIDC